MQTVDVLRDDRGQLACLLQLRKLAVRGIRELVQREHLVLIELVELLGLVKEERMAQNDLRGIVVFLIVQSVDTAEIRNAALGRNTGAAEKDDAVVFVNHAL